MVRFIKLMNLLVNTSQIIKIKSCQNKYYIHMNNNKNINGFIIISVGALNTTDNIIEVCEKEDPVDYQIITQWIYKIQNNI